MDENANPVDTCRAEGQDQRSLSPVDHRPLLRWDQQLAAVRRAPQLSAVTAAGTAHQRPEAEPLRLLRGAGAPTWNGVQTVLTTLRRKNLLPEKLPRTSSAAVMFTHLLTELALIVSGHRDRHPDLAVRACETRADLAQVRFETECITWLLTGRLGVKAAAAGTLKGYLRRGELIPEFSRSRVLKTVDRIEDLFGGALAFGTLIREENPSLFDLDASLAV